MQLEGRIVLVTGGAKRIGAVLALALARRGAHVAFSYRKSAGEADKTAKAITECGVEVLAVKADLSKRPAVERLFAQIRKRWGRLDVLINCASNFERVPYAQLKESDWDHALDANLKGPFLCSLYASRLMQKHGGKIINFADWAGVRPYKNYLPYCVSKAGVIGLTKGLAKELAPRIQVNAVAPGPILPPTDMSGRARRRVARRVPLKRWGNPQDIANTVLFLIEGTDFMTGTTIFVDGGQLIA